MAPEHDIRPRAVMAPMQTYLPPALQGLSSFPRRAVEQTRVQSPSDGSTTQQCEPSSNRHWQLEHAWAAKAMASRERARDVMRTILSFFCGPVSFSEYREDVDT